MPRSFCFQSILYLPHELPTRHWELEKQWQPTGRLVEMLRLVDFVKVIPKPEKRWRGNETGELDVGEYAGVCTLRGRLDALLMADCPLAFAIHAST